MSYVRKHPLSAFGAEVKMELMLMNRTQSWLIAEINQRFPFLYVDSSVINKVLTGRIKSGKVVEAVKEVLSEEKAT